MAAEPPLPQEKIRLVRAMARFSSATAWSISDGRTEASASAGIRVSSVWELLRHEALSRFLIGAH
jgi:hypothetical protein